MVGRRLSRWGVAAVGGGLLAATLVLFVATGGTRLGTLWAAVGTASALALAVVGASVARDPDVAAVDRVLAWCLVGAAVLGGTGLGTVLLAPTGGLSNAALQPVVADASLGGLAGALVGRYDARQRRARRRGERQRTETQMVLDNAPVVLFRLDDDGVVTLSEGRGLDAMGMEPGDLVGESVFDAYADAPEVLEACERALDGERVHQELAVGTATLETWMEPVETGDGTAVVGTAVDVSERAEREAQLATLHDASRALFYASDADEVATETVDIAERVLDMPLSTLWQYDEAAEELVPMAMTPSTRELLAAAGVETLSAIGSDRLGMEVFLEGETRVIENYADVEHRAFPELPLGTVVIVPVGEHGILEVGRRTSGPVDVTTRRHAEILALNAGAALDRASREAELERMRARFRALTENSPVGIVTVDEGGTLRFASDGVETILGYEPDDIEGEPLTTLVPERLRDAHREGFARYLSTGERTLDWSDIELPGRHADGSEVELGLSFGELERDGERLFTGILRDVSDRKRQERQIRALQEATLSLADATSVEAVAETAVEIARDVLDRPFAVLWTHDATEGALVPQAGTATAEAFVREHGMDDLPTLGEETPQMRVFREGETRVHQRYQDAEGSVRLPLGTTIHVPLDDHGLLGFGSREPREVTETERYLVDIFARNVAAALDRVARERTLADLHEATREMMTADGTEAVCEEVVAAAERVLDIPISGVWLVDESGQELRPVTNSGAANELFGEVPVFREGEPSLAWRAFADGEPLAFDDVREAEGLHNEATPARSELVLPLGDEGVLLAGATEPAAFDDADLLFARLLAANATTALERAERERQLRTRTDQMEFFNSILRHDVLNGMTVIRGRAAMLAEADDIADRHREQAATVVDWADDVTEVVGRVRSVLEALTGEGDRSFGPVDLAALVREECARVRETYPGVTVETDVPAEAVVLADDLLAEVVGNLVTNAVEHNRDAESLTVRASVETDGDRAVLRVRDDGTGVPDDRKDAVFRRGETGHAKTAGSGFGLFFVDAMADSYGGSVHVEDNDDGGATFVLALPTPGDATEEP